MCDPRDQEGYLDAEKCNVYCYMRGYMMGQEMADLRQSQCEEAKEAAKGSTGSSGVSAMECQQLVQPPLQTPNSNSL